MTRPDLERVQEIFSSVMRVPHGTPMTDLSAADMGADSLDEIEIMMGLEDAFGVEIPAETEVLIMRPQDALDLVTGLLDGAHASCYEFPW